MGRPVVGLRQGDDGRDAGPGLDVTCYDARSGGYRVVPATVITDGPQGGQLLFVARGARLLLWGERWDAGTHVEFAHFRVGCARLRPPGSFAVAETAFALGLRRVVPCYAAPDTAGRSGDAAVGYTTADLIGHLRAHHWPPSIRPGSDQTISPASPPPIAGYSRASTPSDNVIFSGLHWGWWHDPLRRGVSSLPWCLERPLRQSRRSAV